MSDLNFSENDAFKVVTNACILFHRGLMGTVVSLRFSGNVSYLTIFTEV